MMAASSLFYEWHSFHGDAALAPRVIVPASTPAAPPPLAGDACSILDGIETCAKCFRRGPDAGMKQLSGNLEEMR
jgi:hypothetical protein